MEQTDKISAFALVDECHRLADRYRDEPVALEAIQAVLCWVDEECVPPVDGRAIIL